MPHLQQTETLMSDSIVVAVALLLMGVATLVMFLVPLCEWIVRGVKQMMEPTSHRPHEEL